jgi:uncharacterized protein YdeI (YjbR/CyaY-like superfamily)
LNIEVDQILLNGCGRCSLYRTPDCKFRIWFNELTLLRKIVLETELMEVVKWSQPCYTYNGTNVLIVSAFKGYAFISFFKGSLMEDPAGFLHSPGNNSQATRQLRFTSLSQIHEQDAMIVAFLKQAIEIEKKGLKIKFGQKENLKYPEELLKKFDEDPPFQEAFESLSPGRQRSWNLYYTGAKQSKTRVSRIEKSMDNIFSGKGWNER